MTFVITEACIGVKDGTCVEVCPVDCIHPRPDEPEFDEAEQLYIDPGVCIDCDVCVSVCPVDAIYADVEVPEEFVAYVERNERWYQAGGVAG